MTLSIADARRYSRHLKLPEIGVAGQEALGRARVLMIGAGGLGCPALQYLAAAGVGTIGIVDFDRVDESNLQRQVLFTTDDVGRPKVEAAADRLRAMNPGITIEAIDEGLNESNARELIARFDVVVDGTDNFTTRYLIADACHLAGKPLVHGSIQRFDGQVTVFGKPGCACYRCLFPEAPPPELAPNCADAGVLGVLPGIIGALQAAEALKLVLGLETPLHGRLLRFDALAMQFEELATRRDARCALCGNEPTIQELRSEVSVCAANIDPLPSITRDELAEWQAAERDFVLLDVRARHERIAGSLADDVLQIPIDELEEEVDDLDPDRCYVVQCVSGLYSRQAVRELTDAGVHEVYNLAGGVGR